MVTNNEEKALPSAFLRRCIFHYLRFPETEAELDQILALHGASDRTLRDEAIGMLRGLRDLDLAKKPGLSELLDWVGYRQAVDQSVDAPGGLPLAGALIKQRDDQRRVDAWLARG